MPYDNMPPGERSAWANGRAEVVSFIADILIKEEQDYISVNNYPAAAVITYLRHRIANALRQP